MPIGVFYTEHLPLIYFNKVKRSSKQDWFRVFGAQDKNILGTTAKVK